MFSYCSLLTRGVNLRPKTTVYPSTAPDSLRHWNDKQKSRLKQSVKGEKLLSAANKQAEEWKQKYDSLSAKEKETMTFENFLWAMEAVHSRAFRGNFGGEVFDS